MKTCNYFKKNQRFFNGWLGLCLIRRLLLMSLFLVIIPLAKADTHFGTADYHLIITPDNANGVINIKYLILETAGTDDEMDRAVIYYRNSLGNRVGILNYTHQSFWNGYDESYNVPYSSSGNSPDLYYDGVEQIGSQFFAKFKWKKIPTALLGTQITFEMDYCWDMNHDQAPHDPTDGTLMRFVNTATIGEPGNLTATENSCGKIDISWQHPAGNGINTSSVSYAVYRGSTLIGSTTTTTYTDYGGSPGTQYSYKVIAFVLAGQTIHYQTSNTDIGYKMGLPVYRPNAYVTQSRCAQQVVLTWQYNGTANLDHFKIERSSSSTFSTITLSVDVPATGTVQQYYDSGVSDNTSYYYRLSARNACDETTAVNPYETLSIHTDFTLSSPEIISALTTDGKIKVAWGSLSCYAPQKVELEKKYLQTGAVENIAINAATEYYIDDVVVPCQSYRYVLKITRTGGAVYSSNYITEYVRENIDGVITEFSASKGHFANRVELKWKADKANLVESYKIYRRAYGAEDYRLVQDISDRSTTWTDENADAGTYYEYKIQAFTTCINQVLESNIMESVGFRNPRGLVAGQVNFEGGNAVDSVKVLVNRSSDEAILGNCLSSNENSSMIIPNSQQNFDISKSFAVDFWLKTIDVNNYANLIQIEIPKSPKIFTKYVKCYLDGAYLHFSYGSKVIEHPVVMFTGTFPNFRPTGTKWRMNQWNHVMLTMQKTNDGSADYANIKMYINDILVAESDQTEPIITGNFSKIEAFNNFTGYVDELRFWDERLSENFEQIDANRIANGNEDGLLACYHFDEGFGTFAFDYARTGKEYHDNHAELSLVGWSTQIPDATQLGYYAFTKQDGSYLIEGIPYFDNGEMFAITPMKDVHEFEPATRSVYIGDAATAHNNQDFADISSFKVTGRIRYVDTDFGVEGVDVLVDGKPVVGPDNWPVKTNASGEFTVSVPIGKHYISVQKNGHGFKQAFWPALYNGLPQKYNFLEPITGMQFLDTTKVKLAGRIVGGPIEASKKLGFGLSKNNLGTATVKLVPVKPQYLHDGTTENNWVKFSTNQSTGEYETWIIPEEFKVDSVGFGATKLIDAEYLTNIDLTNKTLLRSITDSVFHQEEVDGEMVAVFDSIRTFSYHHLRDWIYRINPSVDVSMNGTNWLSDSIYVYRSETGNESINLKGKHNSHVFGYPVFSQMTNYRWLISVFESYTNYETGETDKVPVTDAQISVNNNLSSYTETVKLKVNNAGTSSYYFIGGFPMTSKIEGANEGESYLKTASIVVSTPSGKLSTWPESGLYQAYLFGGYPTGNNFVTKGPDNVDLVLRDPPGSNSYSYIKKGSHTETTSTYNTKSVNTENDYSELDLGYTTSTIIGGFGISVALDIASYYNEVTKVISNKTVINDSTFTSSIDFQESFSTSSLPEFVGSEGDVFLGHSSNLVYGLANKLGIIKPGDEADGNRLNAVFDGTYTIGVRKGLRMNPEFDTYFVYTQKHIKNNLIPDLRMLRNLLFQTSPTHYVSKLDVSHPYYASNNDDLCWGTNWGDNLHDGISYRFTPDEKDTVGIDSVRFYNNQIAQWQRILEQNEEQKVKAIPNEQHSNISFDNGTRYENYTVASSSFETYSSFEFNIDKSTAVKTGMIINGYGYIGDFLQTSHKNIYELEQNSGNTKQEIGFVLEDTDPNNYFTVDVMDCPAGHGAIFKTRGGQSSCPYEGEELTQYYHKGQEILNQATMTLNNPVLTIDRASQMGIPENEAAIFTLTLANQADVQEDSWFNIKVNNASNPDGAKIFMDGSPLASLGMSVLIPAGRTLTKTLEVFKGAPSVNVYNNIEIYMAPICNASQQKDAALFSVEFVPACSNVELASPVDGWIANVYSSNTVNIELNGYNTNLSTFKYLAIQAKSKSEVNWSSLMIYYKHQADFDASTSENKALIESPNKITYLWDITNYVDREYQLRAISVCNDGSQNITDIANGIIDRNRPKPFGIPQPADGILAAGDNIMVQFDEEIEDGLLLANPHFVSVKGVLNGTELSNGISQHFNGSNQFALAQNGPLLGNTSFTIEAWINATTVNGGTIWSIGEGVSNQMKLSINTSGNLVFSDGGFKHIGAQVLQSNKWYHVGITYDKSGKNLNMFINDIAEPTKVTTLSANPQGRMALGYDHVEESNYFNGNIRDFRIWTKALSQGSFAAQKSKTLSGNEPYLASYYLMDEKQGTWLHDKAHLRHAQTNANWQVDPTGAAVVLNGINQYVDVDGSRLQIGVDVDFTLETWFRSTNASKTQCILSGIGNTRFDNPDNDFEVTLNDLGAEMVSNGKRFVLTETDLRDQLWHHLAIVVNRKGSAKAYIDGVFTNQTDADGFGGIGEAELAFGAKMVMDEVTEINSLSNHFEGNLDELRIWYVARTAQQVSAYMNHRIATNQVGLAGYYPFEKYELDGASVMLMFTTLEDQFAGTPVILPAARSANFVGDASFDASNTAQIALERPVKLLNKTLVVNQDKVIIQLEAGMDELENVLLEFTIRDVQDKHGNILASPVQWTAFVKRNQIVWDDASIALEKEVGEELSFTATLRNKGGVSQSFYLNNLPTWLMPSESSGTLSPLESKVITFTVSEAINSGTYECDIYAESENGVNERLSLDLRVFKPAPEWAVNPEKYEYSMNAIGLLSFNGMLSRNANDRVAVFNAAGQCRGVAPLTYVKQNDLYMVFIDMYGNSGDENQPYSVKVWNDYSGEISTNIKVKDGSLVSNSITFVSGEFLGSTQNPVRFMANDTLEQSIPLAAGWNWLSFNLSTPGLNDLNQLFSSLTSQQNDLLKSGASFATYNVGFGWFGSLFSANNTSMYMLNNSLRDTIVYNGVPVVASATNITLNNGWNWIGFTPRYSMPVADAFVGLNPQANDVVKGQRDFAIYDSGLGWIGSLKSMKPTHGYMYLSKKSTASSFTYPNQTTYAKSATIVNSEIYEALGIHPEQFENNMNIIASVNGVECDAYYLVAESNGVRVGAGESMQLSGQSYYFCTVYGNIASTLQFKLLSKRGGESIALDKTIPFEKDVVLGTLDNPILFGANNETPVAEISGEGLMNAWPNPFTNVLHVSLPLCNESKVQLMVYDITGKAIGILYEGTYPANGELVFNVHNTLFANVSSGIYVLSVQTENNTQVVRVSKR